MEQSKLEKYITEYGRDIYSFCVFLTKNRQEADDLYQDAFLCAIEKGKLDYDENPKAYIIKVAINIWNNRKRKYLWRKKIADITYFDEVNNYEHIPDKGIGTDNQAIINIEIEEMRVLVAGLPDKMRVVVLMYYMEDMKVEEIAGILGISSGTVKSRLYHARKLLVERKESSNEG